MELFPQETLDSFKAAKEPDKIVSIPWDPKITKIIIYMIIKQIKSHDTWRESGFYMVAHIAGRCPTSLTLEGRKSNNLMQTLQKSRWNYCSVMYWEYTIIIAEKMQIDSEKAQMDNPFLPKEIHKDSKIYTRIAMNTSSRNRVHKWWFTLQYMLVEIQFWTSSRKENSKVSFEQQVQI